MDKTDHTKLLIWMPLNGDLRNLGSIGNSYMYASKTPGYSTWKAGKCYQSVSGGYPCVEKVTVGTDVTVMAWVKSSTLGGMFFGITSNSNGNMNIWNSGGYLYLNTGDSTNNPFKNSSGTACAAITDNTWHHLAFVFSGSNNCKYYKDGVYQGAATTYKNPTSTNKTWSVAGCFGYGAAYTQSCYIADYRVYSYALSEDEIASVTKVKVAHYPLNKDLYNVYKLPTMTYDSATWGCVLDHQQPSVNGVFASLDKARSSGNYGDLLYSRLALLSGSNFKNSSGYVEFLVEYTNTSDDTVKYVRWQQTVNPYDSGITSNAGVGFVNKSNATNGLCRYHGSALYAYSNSKASDWWGAVGAVSKNGGGIPFKSYNITTGYLKMYVRLDGIVSSKTHDISGFHNDLNVVGSTSLSDDTKRYDKCTNFNGSTYLLSDGNIGGFDFNNATISVWLKPHTTPSNWTGSFGIAYTTTSGKSFAISNYGGLFTVHYTNGGFSRVLSEALSIDTWYHLAATLDGTTLKMYINGVLKNTATISWGSTSNPSTGYIECGGDLPGSIEKTNGWASDFRIYAYTLSDDEITELYNLGK